jgi:hypothetical protein
MTSLELSVLAAVLGLYGLFIVLLLIVAWIRGARWQRRHARTAVEVPRIRAALINYLAGNNDVTVFRDTVVRNRRDFESALVTLQSTVGGGGLERLCALVLELGLVHEWCQEAQSRDQRLRRAAFSRLAFACFYEPCRRVAGDLVFRALADPDRDVSMLAARAAIHSADQSEIEEVFNHTIRQSLRERILLNDGLRRHAVALCERAVPEALAFGGRDSVLATLRTLVAWERAIPLEHLEELLQSEDREIRLEAIRLAPFVPVTAGNRTAIVAALSDPDSEIAAAAAISATRLRFHEAIPQLAGLLATAPAEVARQAASGLAEMPPDGWRTLEQISVNANPVAATAARAALSAARGRARK